MIVQDANNLAKFNGNAGTSVSDVYKAAAGALVPSTMTVEHISSGVILWSDKGGPTESALCVEVLGGVTVGTVGKAKVTHCDGQAA